MSIRFCFSGSAALRAVASQQVSQSASQQRFPRLYPIVDEGVLVRHGLDVRRFAAELRAARVRLLQYRNKLGGPQEVLRSAEVIHEVMVGSGCRLIMNDRADLAAIHCQRHNFNQAWKYLRVAEAIVRDSGSVRRGRGRAVLRRGQPCQSLQRRSARRTVRRDLDGTGQESGYQQN